MADLSACFVCTHILVSLTLRDEVDLSRAMTIMRDEMIATAHLYLSGKLHHWFSQLDNRGVLFLLATSSPDEVRSLIEELPFVRAGWADLQFTRLGPLLPMQTLLHPL